jgi:hypothetical protein
MLRDVSSTQSALVALRGANAGALIDEARRRRALLEERRNALEGSLRPIVAELETLNAMLAHEDKETGRR